MSLGSPVSGSGRCRRLAGGWLCLRGRLLGLLGPTWAGLVVSFLLFVFPDQGYLFISVLVNSNSELIRLINNAIKNDLASRNPTFMGLALHCIANVGSREMAEAFAGEIPKVLVAGYVSCDCSQKSLSHAKLIRHVTAHRTDRVSESPHAPQWDTCYGQTSGEVQSGLPSPRA